jgi:hypothetical protein
LESIYWVFTLRCNDRCAHCYNNSSPKGETLETAELLRVIPNLPDKVGRVILSGGEPTMEMEKLTTLVTALRKRYPQDTGILLQSNGDLLDGGRLKALEEMGIDRLDIVSMDRFHKHQGARREELETLFLAGGWKDGSGLPEGQLLIPGSPAYAFWGANEDIWLGGNWARGRALENNHAYMNPTHNFCSLWSGALGFLDDGSPRQEVHVQLSRLYPCCPTSYLALGDVREESVEVLLNRYRDLPDWRALSQGEPSLLGGDPKHAQKRIQELGDVCLWCDEFFREHYQGPRGPIRSPEQRTSLDV